MDCKCLKLFRINKNTVKAPIPFVLLLTKQTNSYKHKRINGISKTISYFLVFSTTRGTIIVKYEAIATHFHLPL